MTKIQDIHSYSSLSTAKNHHLLYESRTQLKDNYIFRNKNCLIGIEIEVENIRSSLCGNLDYYWAEDEDHSLRNYGREYKSIPMRAYQIPYSIEYLKQLLSINNPKYEFSNRCSVHVHLNVRDFTMEQLACFLILYCVFEKHFFHIAGTKRENNIFCVPLWTTDYLPNLKKLVRPESYKAWHKYLALNCGCIFGSENNKDFGTVEFRHLYGTLDTKILYPWINSIIALREASSKYKLDELVEEIITANTTSQYLYWYDTIFQDLKISPALMTKKDHEYGISNLKQSLFAFNNIKTYDYINTQDNHLIRFHNLQGKKKVSEENKYSMDDLLGELMTVNNHILFIDTPPVPGTPTPVFTTTDPDTITTQG